jgi:ethanolamine ammonia-lyase large subunit
MSYPQITRAGLEDHFTGKLTPRASDSPLLS